MYACSMVIIGALMVLFQIWRIGLYRDRRKIVASQFRFRNR